jgi:3',5'-cyclic AMP phosphodiesterase CpdA
MNGFWKLMVGFLCLVLVGLWTVRAAEQPSPQSSFPSALHSIASSTVAPYRFIAFGDWGTGNAFQKAIAKQIITLYQKQPFDSALLLGDNIYEYGDVKKYGKAYFTDTYTPLLQGGVKFIVALGNHDRRGGFQDDQVRFFGMPGYYYKIQKPGIDFFVLDTNTFGNDEIQQKWLKKSLSESKAHWQIVMAHHPIYSSGGHGSSPLLKKTLEPILIQGGADLYLAGHDHNYERFKPIQGVQHIVAGGGGAYLHDFVHIVPQSQIRLKTHHFLSFESDASGLKMKVYDKTGVVVDQATWALPKTSVQPMVDQG